jgi:hypothetical protein
LGWHFDERNGLRRPSRKQNQTGIIDCHALAHIDVTRMLGIVGAGVDAVLLMAILAGTIASKTGIFLSRLNY